MGGLRLEKDAYRKDARLFLCGAIPVDYAPGAQWISPSFVLGILKYIQSFVCFAKVRARIHGEEGHCAVVWSCAVVKTP